MAVVIEDTAAQADLEAILEGITQEYGLHQALEVADAVVQAAGEGRIDGRNYTACDCTSAGCGARKVCVIGHIALALNSFEDDGLGDGTVPVVPAWTYHQPGITPIEYLVVDVRPGDTPADNNYLYTLVSWLHDWTASRRV